MNVAMEKRSRNKGFREAKMAFFFRAVVGAVATFGLSSATDSGIPSDYTVVHANVVMRHGERSRLVKSTAAEFGNNDGVAVREDGEKSDGLGGGGGGRKEGIVVCTHYFYFEEGFDIYIYINIYIFFSLIICACVEIPVLLF